MWLTQATTHDLQDAKTTGNRLLPTRISRLQLPPFHPASSMPDGLNYDTQSKPGKIAKSSQQASKTPQSRGLVSGI